MNCSPTLTADDFKTIHNTLWELEHQGLDGAEGARRIRAALASAYEQDNRAFDVKHSHYESIRDELGLRSIWSIFEVDNLSERHPFAGADRVVYKDHWGDEPVQCSINGLTWAALYVAADACIRDSGDQHHAFIERFKPSKEDPRTLVLSTGS